MSRPRDGDRARVLRCCGAAVLALLLFPLLPTVEAPPSVSAPEVLEGAFYCPDWIFYPIDVQVIADRPAEPGAVVEASIRITARRALSAATLRIAAPTSIGLLTPRLVQLGDLAPGESRRERLAVRLPPSSDRHTVEVSLRGWSGGHPLSRSAVLNLLPGGNEPFRLVARPDGRRIREVRARRVD